MTDSNDQTYKVYDTRLSFRVVIGSVKATNSAEAMRKANAKWPEKAPYLRVELV